MVVQAFNNAFAANMANSWYNAIMGNKGTVATRSSVPYYLARPGNVPYARQYRKKGAKRPPMRLGKKHVKVQEQVNGDLTSANITDAYCVTDNIGIGDKIDERQSNKILSRYVSVRLNLYNYLSSPRNVRIILFQIRPSATAAVGPPNWTDFFLDSAYTAKAPNGEADQLIWRVNGEHYKVLADKIVQVTGASADKPALSRQFVFKTRKLVRYAYNSSDVTSGDIYVMFAYNEAQGIGPSVTSLKYGLQIRHAYTDIDN